MASLLLGKRVFPLESLQGPAVLVRALLGTKFASKGFADVALKFIFFLSIYNYIVEC